MFLFALVRRWFGSTVTEVEANARRFRDSEDGRRADAKTIWVLMTAAVALSIQNYACHPFFVQPLVGLIANAIDGPEREAAARAVLQSWGRDKLSELLWWFGVAVSELQD